MKKYFFILMGFIMLTINVHAQIITTIAGTGIYGYNGDGIAATTAKLNNTPRITIDACGNVYIADAVNNRVRKVDAATGIITTVAGTGVAGFSGDGGLATVAQLNLPTCVAFDNVGNLYIGDANNDRIRKVDAVTGIISTYAGNGLVGYSGDGGLADTSSIDEGDMAFDPFGNMYMCTLNRVCKIDTAGIITTIAGTGDTGTTLDGVPATSTNITTWPAINTDTYGNVFFVDGRGSILKVTVSTGILSRVAGTGISVGTYTGDGTVATACYMNPASVYIDSAGNIYTAAYTNNICIEIDTLGITHTIAGTGVEGFSGDGGLATAAKLWWPKDLVFDHHGQMYIADWENDRIRKVTYPYTGTNFTDTITASPDDTICPGMAATYTANITGGSSGATYSYEWYVNGSIVCATGSAYTYIPANGDSIRCVCISDQCNGGDSASSNTIYMVVTPFTTPAITISATTSAPIGATVTVTATVAGAGSSYNINWYDNTVLFSTTTVPVVTYTKGAGTDNITATVVPSGEVGCYDSTASAGVAVTVSNAGITAPLAPGAIAVYPNPAHEEITIAGQNITNVTICNLLGQTLVTQDCNCNEVSINIATLPAGVYAVKVTDSEGGKTVSKIVKE